MGNCQYIDHEICNFYNFSKEPGAIEVLTPEYKGRVCHGDNKKCQLWNTFESARATPKEFRELFRK